MPDLALRKIEENDSREIEGRGGIVRLDNVISPAPRSDWLRVWKSDPLSLPTQGPDWAQAVTASHRFGDASRLYRFSDGTLGVLPLFSRTGFPAVLQVLASPPAAWGFGGLLSNQPLTSAHYRLVTADLESVKAVQVSIRPNPFCSFGWQEAGDSRWVRLPRRAHTLVLDTDFATIRAQRFSSNARRHLKIAHAAGLELVTGNSPQIVSEFHALLVHSFDRWAIQQGEPTMLARMRGRRRDPLAKFIAMSEALGPQMKIFLARLDARPVAAILVLYGRNAHYTRGAMDKTLAAPTAANYLLHAAAIEEACLRECGSYHMGETGSSKSLADFKEKFGACSFEYQESRYERLPVSRIDASLRTIAKRMVGMKNG